MKLNASAMWALGALIIAGLVSFVATWLSETAQDCENAKAEIQRIELISGLDVLLIESPRERALGLAQDKELADSEVVQELVDDVVKGEQEHRSNAFQDYLRSRQEIDDLDTACERLDHPRSFFTLAEWLANFLAAVLIFMAGLSLGRSRRDMKDGEDA